MNTYFAFPASPELSQSSLTLMENFDEDVAESQSSLFIKVSQLFADEVVDALLLNLVQSADSEHGGVIARFANAIKSTVNMLIRQVLRHMSNEELRPQADYIRRRRLILSVEGGTGNYVAFPLPAEVHQRFRTVLERAVQGEKDEPELQACMEQFVDLACVAFYDEALERLKLGFLGRKTVNVGGSVIHKGGRSASRHLISGLEGEHLKHCAEYLLALLVTEDVAAAVQARVPQ